MNRDIKRYFKECKLLFASYGKEEKEFLDKVKSNIEYDGSQLSYNDIVERLGQPKDIIISYYEGKDSMYLVNKAKSSKSIKKSLAIISVIIILILGCISYVYYNEYQRSNELSEMNID